jgi:F0F1-type ATP synthase membrane subunit c/vacuolar-type H+-ATPase subunit K
MQECLFILNFCGIKVIVQCMQTKFLLSSFISFVLFFSFVLHGYAQSAKEVDGAATLGVAKMIEVKDKNVKDGSIIASSDKGSQLCSIPYDPQVLGIVSRDAGIILSTKNTENGVPVISNGTVYMLVSSKNGAIKKGDLLTTSTIPGVGVKADKDGYVLGSALEEYSNPDPKQVDKIAVDLNLHYFNSKPTFPGTLSDIMKLALLPTKDAPSPIFKYIVAAAVVLGSFVLGFLTFGRTAAKGIEALGRNPSASKIIHLGIIFNVAIVVVIVLAGMTVAFLILRL